MKVAFAQAAERDLNEIGAFIARDNPRRALSFVLELLAACEAIGDSPLGSPILARYARLEYRKRTFRDYLIIYRVTPDEVQIVRVLHGARDFERLLDG